MGSKHGGISLSEEDRAKFLAETVTAAGLIELSKKYDCSVDDIRSTIGALRAAAERERLLLAADSASTVEDLRQVVSDLIRKLL